MACIWLRATTGNGNGLNRTGMGSTTSGGWLPAVPEPASGSRTYGSFRPRSTLVLMYSRPWMPSRVGRTISDMSNQIASKPPPANGPPYPAPEMGIFPRSAMNHVCVMIFAVQYGSPRPGVVNGAWPYFTYSSFSPRWKRAGSANGRGAGVVPTRYRDRPGAVIAVEMTLG